MAKQVKKKRVKKVVTEGRAYIKSTFNNTLITLTDTNGNVLVCTPAGTAGFKGSRKSTPYAAQMAATAACEKAKSFGLERVDVFVKGIGSGRESAVRAISASGIYVNTIKDVTPMPHNGVRPPKARRV